MNHIPARGFVLASSHYAEADKIAQLYTLQLGKVHAVVKGVRKPKSKLAHAMELFTESSFSLHQKTSGDFFILSQAKVLNGYPELKKDFSTITALQVLADMVIQAIHDTEPHQEVYFLLKETLLAMMERQEERELLLAAFALKLLDLMGYPLELDQCVECGSPLRRQKASLIPHRGGALCGACCPSAPERLRISPAGLEVLKKLKSLPMAKAHVLRMKPAFLRGLFLTVLEYLGETIEKPLKTVGYYLEMIPDS